MLSDQQLTDFNHQCETLEPKDILALSIESIANVAIAFSGAEDVVLIAMASRIKPDIPIFTLDTGRLHPETYRFIEKVREHYGVEIELLSPDAVKLGEMVKAKGLFSFYEDGHEECCGIRKIEPLQRYLAGVDGWITGQRRDQSPTRAQLPIAQYDMTFSTDSHRVTKFSPLANWSLQQVWDYMRMFDVPFNELHKSGFISIGCEPCTRAIQPGQHERVGRWWWEEATQKECGLHIENID